MPPRFLSDDLRAASCDGKASYGRTTARMLARKANARKHDVRRRVKHQTAGTAEDRIPELRAYRCPVCARWHVAGDHAFGKTRAELLAEAEALDRRASKEDRDA